MNIEEELQKLEEEKAHIAELQENLKRQKAQQEEREKKLDEIVEQSGFETPKELVEALIARYNIRLTGKVAKKATRRTRTKMTPQLRDQLKAQIEGGKSMNKVAKETGISYVVVAKVRNGEYDHL